MKISTYQFVVPFLLLFYSTLAYIHASCRIPWIQHRWFFFCPSLACSTWWARSDLITPLCSVRNITYLHSKLIYPASRNAPHPVRHIDTAISIITTAHNFHMLAALIAALIFTFSARGTTGWNFGQMLVIWQYCHSPYKHGDIVDINNCSHCVAEIIAPYSW